MLRREDNPIGLDREEALTRAKAEAAERWPELRPDLPAFTARLEALLDAGKTTAAQLPDLALADLLLAATCLSNEPTALAILERDLLPHVTPAIRRVDPSATFIDEVLQQLRERVLLGTRSGPARLNDYDGRGSLLAWLRVIAVRLALNLKSPANMEVQLGQTLADALRATGSDPELTALKVQLRDELDEAITRAVTALTSEERLLLRMHLVDGLSIDRLDKLMGLHRATVARKLAAARASLLANTRRELTKRMGLLVSRGELQRVTELVQSQLEVSLDRLLALP